jgi:hypothetical protein
MIASQRLGDHGTLEMLDLLRQAAAHFANVGCRDRLTGLHLINIRQNPMA